MYIPCTCGLFSWINLQIILISNYFGTQIYYNLLFETLNAGFLILTWFCASIPGAICQAEFGQNNNNHNSQGCESGEKRASCSWFPPYPRFIYRQRSSVRLHQVPSLLDLLWHRGPPLPSFSVASSFYLVWYLPIARHLVPSLSAPHLYLVRTLLSLTDHLLFSICTSSLSIAGMAYHQVVVLCHQNSITPNWS